MLTEPKTILPLAIVSTIDIPSPFNRQGEGVGYRGPLTVSLALRFFRLRRRALLDGHFLPFVHSLAIPSRYREAD